MLRAIFVFRGDENLTSDSHRLFMKLLDDGRPNKFNICNEVILPRYVKKRLQCYKFIFFLYFYVPTCNCHVIDD